MIARFRHGNMTETRPVHGKLDHHVSAARKRDRYKQLPVSVEFTGNTLFRPEPCYPLLPLNTLCYSCPLLPLVTPCYPLLLLLPLVTPCYPCYPLLPLVTPCYPLLPLVTFVTPCYPLLPLFPLVTFVTPCYPC